MHKQAGATIRPRQQKGNKEMKKQKEPTADRTDPGKLDVNKVFQALAEIAEMRNPGIKVTVKSVRRKEDTA